MAARPPPPPPPLDLADDVLLSILGRVPCRADRVQMALVCRAWRTVIARLQTDEPPRPPLPCLLLPPRLPDGGPTPLVCVLSGCHAHHCASITPPGARCIGCHDGAWVLLHFRHPNHSHALFNVRTREARPLPGVVYRCNAMGLFDMAIHAAALSAPSDDPRCVVAAIVSSYWDPVDSVLPRRRGVALLGEWSGVAHEIWADEAGRQDLNAEDVVYDYGSGAFHILTHGNHIRLCSPIVDRDRRLQTLGIVPGVRRFSPIACVLDDQHIRARYLVRSRDELLLVLRLTPRPDDPRTSAFKVFVQMPNAAADIPNAEWSWSELHTLGGRILFVGHGCSRSYEASQYPGFDDAIYFLDDGAFHDEHVIFGNLRQYPCSDNGSWSEGRVQLCFPMPEPSNSSPPAWLLP